MRDNTFSFKQIRRSIRRSVMRNRERVVTRSRSEYRSTSSPRQAPRRQHSFHEPAIVEDHQNLEIDLPDPPTESENFYDKEFEFYNLDWVFFKRYDRLKSIVHLREKPVGSFLIRRKDANVIKPYVVSVKVSEDYINHFWICVKNDDGKKEHSYHIDSGHRLFSKVDELLKYYSENSLGNLFDTCPVCLNFPDGENKRLQLTFEFDDKIQNHSEKNSDDKIIAEIETREGKTYKIIGIRKVIKSFLKSDFPELEKYKQVPTSLSLFELLYEVKHDDENAKRNNWLKVVDGRMNVLFVPAKFTNSTIENKAFNKLNEVEMV